MTDRRIARPVLAAAVIGYIALCAAVTGIRWNYLLTIGSLFKVTGSEGPAVYSVWKARHGDPLYEWPQRDNLSPTLYNFLFYETYGSILRGLNVSDTDLITAGRAITATFAVFGAVVTWRLVRLLEPEFTRPGSTTWLLTAFAVALWLGPGSTVWWSVSVRPDVAAAVFAIAGAACLIRALPRNSAGWAVVASACFFLDWTFKQSAVWTLAGSGLYLLLARRIKLLLGMAVPFATATAVCLAAGGPEYRYNLVTLPAVSPFRPRTMLLVLEVLLPNLFVYGFAFVAVVRGRHDPARRLLGCALVTSSLFGLFALGREGASRNMLFESFFLATALSTAELARILAGTSDRPFLNRIAATVLLFSMWLYPAVNLFAPRLRAGLIRTNLIYGDATAYADRRLMADWMKTLPKPILIPEDEILSQPWFSNDDHYPSYVLDALLYGHMVEAGVFENSGMLGKVRRREFGTVIARPDGDFARAAAEAGYVEKPTPSGLEKLPGDSLGELPLTVWVRTHPPGPEE